MRDRDRNRSGDMITLYIHCVVVSSLFVVMVNVPAMTVAYAEGIPAGVDGA